MSNLPQRPIRPETDLRDMLRQYVVARSLDAMRRASERRRDAVASGKLDDYQRAIKKAVRGFYGSLPVGPEAVTPEARVVGTHDRNGYRLENVLFESFPGWEVNATVYVPREFEAPFAAVVVPVGHSGKQYESYQLPCQLFARSGYLAIVFDPPGQSGEKREGNDHFVDGVRCYPVGESSSRYFVADALRCVDYVASRQDVDAGNGVAMTGVSGGGTTTTLAGLLDERITVLGPSCCVTPLADLDISQCYSGCPETHMWGRYAEGVDEIDLVCAAAPRPVLLMAGQQDEVFRIGDTRVLAEEARSFYERAGVAERLEFFADTGGHGYSLAQARQFVRFLHRWLPGERVEALELPDTSFHVAPAEDLQCHPRTDVNMRSLAIKRSHELRCERDSSADAVRGAAGELVDAQRVSPPSAEAGAPFRVWTHYWQQVMLRPESGIELPATLLYGVDGASAPTLLHFDDQGRDRLLRQDGALAQAVRFLERDEAAANLLTVDLRGWGDTSMALYPYEIASWGGTDRYLAYASAALGDSVMSMRVRDALSALAYVRSRPEADADGVVVSGCGLGGVVARHVAAIDANLRGLVVWDTLESFEGLVGEEHPCWPQDAFMPNVLLHYDLPELTAAVTCPVMEFGRSDDLERDGVVDAMRDLLAATGPA